MWEAPIALPRQGFDPKTFRAALGHFATGVCIVTTVRANGKHEGLTISSFNSVSLNPPMVLWSLTRTSPSAPAFRDAEFFAVNVLGADQQELSTHFARPAEDKFAAFADLFVAGHAGLPLLEGAVARFQCRNQFQNYGGDHIVFIGTVEIFEHFDGAPLVFHRGRYAALASR